MTELLLHPAVKAQIDTFLTRPAHALLLRGAPGSGKGTLAALVAGRLLDLSDVGAVQQQPFFLKITPEEGTIPIAAVRRLHQHLKLKTPGRRPIRRVVIIEDAHRMGVEAQNAFLKILEEPPDDTVIILTAARAGLLPTILSRTQQITVQAPPQELVTAFLKGRTSDAALQKYRLLSRGQPGLLLALIAENDNHPLIQGLEEFKSLLHFSSFDRLTHVEKLSKDKAYCDVMLDAGCRLAKAALIKAAADRRVKDINHWYRVLSSAYRCRLALSRNANPKLALTELLLNL